MKRNFAIALLQMCISVIIFTTASFAQNTYPWPSTGNIGIGTTSPSFKLSLAGTSASDKKIGFDGLQVIYQPDQSASKYVGSLALGNGLNSISHYAAYSGQNNTALGIQALVADTSGGDNTAAGTSSLNKNLSGNDNSAFGYGSLYNNTTGGSNTAVGSYALLANANGNGNVSLGYSSMYTNTSGSQNFAAGTQALYLNLGGNYNIGIGQYALYSNSSGAGNVGTGFNSLATNSTGSNNIASGQYALYLTTASNNVAIGYNSLYNTSSGANNVAVGVSSGNNVTTGSNNIALGYSTNQASATASNQMNIGNALFGTGLSGSVSSPAGKLGVLTNSPNVNSALDVNGNLFVANKVVVGLDTLSTAGYTTLINSGTPYTLAVNGNAIFTRARVKLLTNWPDYVFDDNYNLMSLSDLETYIKKEKHLPNVPSAETIQKDGIDLGDNQIVLLQRIEDLTLYTIESDKKIKELEILVQKQSTQIDALLNKGK